MPHSEGGRTIFIFVAAVGWDGGYRSRRIQRGGRTIVIVVAVVG